MPLINLTGQTFGAWRVLERAENKGKKTMWLCECACGMVKAVATTNLTMGKSWSCGCVYRSRDLPKGYTLWPEYMAWKNMKARCYNATVPYYDDYGGRGIKVCSSWRRSFRSFYSDMGNRPSEDHSIDRIDNGLGYYPPNCRWGTVPEQQRNKRSNRLVSWQGETMPAICWAERLGLSKGALQYRLNHIPLEIAMTMRYRQRAKNPRTTHCK